MTDNQKRILEMVADKKITVDEAYRLMSLIEPQSEPDNTGEPKQRKPLPKYLRVYIDSQEHSDRGPTNVNVRVPISLIRAGVKLANLMPPEAYNHIDQELKKKGIEFDLRNIKPENIEELIENLNDLEVNIDGGKSKLRIYLE